MSKIGESMPKEYSDRFDDIRQRMVEMSFYKYGPAGVNFGEKLVDALASHDRCIGMYKKTGNLEYLCDAANYLMFEFMYPQKEGACFRSTDSNESAGISGIAYNQLTIDKHFDRILDQYFLYDSKEV